MNVLPHSEENPSSKEILHRTMNVSGSSTNLSDVQNISRQRLHAIMLTLKEEGISVVPIRSDHMKLIRVTYQSVIDVLRQSGVENIPALNQPPPQFIALSFADYEWIRQKKFSDHSDQIISAFYDSRSHSVFIRYDRKSLAGQGSIPFVHLVSHEYAHALGMRVAHTQTGLMTNGTFLDLNEAITDDIAIRATNGLVNSRCHPVLTAELKRLILTSINQEQLDNVFGPGIIGEIRREFSTQSHRIKKAKEMVDHGYQFDYAQTNTAGYQEQRRVFYRIIQAVAKKTNIAPERVQSHFYQAYCDGDIPSLRTMVDHALGPGTFDLMETKEGFFGDELQKRC